jgi:hypothetical protein
VADQRDSARSADRCIRLATVISVVLLAVIAAIVSFGHMRELALRHGEARWSATLIPLSVDGMVVAASMSVLLTSKTGRRGEWLPWTLLIVGSLASLAANVAVADSTVISRLIAAWPSFAFVGLITCFRASFASVEPIRSRPRMTRRPILGGAR